MMSPHRIGFYRELRHGDPEGPSLRAAIRNSEAPEETRLADYLDGAPVIATTGRLVDDVLDPAHTGVAVLETRTDGAWIWPGDLGYYVRNYHADINAEFLEHARSNNYTPPALDDRQMSEIIRQVRGDPE
jgi:hypothetical protein